jgi:hypothetical protein
VWRETGREEKNKRVGKKKSRLYELVLAACAIERFANDVQSV